MCTPAPIVDKSKPRLKDEFYFPYPKTDKAWFTCDPSGFMEPRCSKQGMASAGKCPPTTIPALFDKLVLTKGSKDALLVERNANGVAPPLEGGLAPPGLPRDQWKKWTFKEYHSESKMLARAFMKMEFQQFDTVNIWGFNSPEWFISVMAGIYAGGKCGGLYPTDTPGTAAFKVVHSGGAVCCVENQTHIDKLVVALNSEDRMDCKNLKAFVSWSYTPKADETVDIKGVGKIPVFAWKAALEMGNTLPETALAERTKLIQPGHCCGLIYTSGTTGDPKAVMVSNDGIIYMGGAVITTVGQTCGFATTPEEERVLSYLPLSHVAGFCTDVVAQINAGAMTPSYSACFFARPYDLKAGTIKDRLLTSRPTIFLGVPLVWEKMADRIKAIGAAVTGCKKTVSTWAKGKALQHAKDIQLGGSGAVPMNHCLAMKILKAVKGAVGLDQCKYALTGAAPIRTDTLEYYGSLGIYINELYGMSESSAIVTISTDQAHQWGTVGYQLEGCEVQVFKVDPVDFNKKTVCEAAPHAGVMEDQYMGELCFRGRGIMMGYLACKAMGEEHVKMIQKKTEEAIDADGWMHSGDKGLRTVTGMYKITGRYKELIIGEGGENIAPVPIEDSIKGQIDAIGECMMIGDKRKYNVALVTLKAKGANGEVPGTDDLESSNTRNEMSSAGCSKISEVMGNKDWIAKITGAFEATNKNGKVVPNNSFKIQKFMIMPHNFSEEGGELTPTKKLKRSIVEKKYLKQIEHMYATDGVAIKWIE